jgi:hypothetical protein
VLGGCSTRAGIVVVPSIAHSIHSCLSNHKVISIENMVPNGSKREGDEYMKKYKHPLLGVL